ncbi:hypothetical protein SDJN03_23348, partial [Cucurbita argyrosperma subsp. sororia]
MKFNCVLLASLLLFLLLSPCLALKEANSIDHGVSSPPTNKPQPAGRWKRGYQWPPHVQPRAPPPPYLGHYAVLILSLGFPSAVDARSSRHHRKTLPPPPPPPPPNPSPPPPKFQWPPDFVRKSPPPPF